MERKKKELALATNLTDKEYNNLTRFLENRHQGFTEYALLCLGKLKEDDFNDLSILVTDDRQKKSLSVRASQCLYDKISEIAKEKGMPKSSVLKIAIKEAIKD